MPCQNEKMRKILISGFEPFAKWTLNPSQDIALKLAKDSKVEAIILPVSFARCFEVLKEQIENFRPSIVLCLGLAEKREKVSLERIAINCMNTSIADNDGDCPSNKLIQTKGPDGLFTNLDLEELLGISPNCVISNSAGTYVCNYLMYQLLFHFKDRIQAGFIHVPAENIEKSYLDIKKIIDFYQN